MQGQEKKQIVLKKMRDIFPKEGKKKKTTLKRNGVEGKKANDSKEKRKGSMEG